jgi:hypothetical protein
VTDDPPAEHPQADIHELFQTALDMGLVDALVWGKNQQGEFAMIGTESLTLADAVALMRKCLAKYEADSEGPGPADKIN